VQLAGFAANETATAAGTRESEPLADSAATAPERQSAPNKAQKPDTPTPPKTPTDLKAIDRLIESGDDFAALRELSLSYWNQPEMHSVIQERLDAAARRIFFSPRPHYMDPYVVQPGDQLRGIAKRYDVSWEYLARLNQIDPRRIQMGQKLKVVKGPFSVLVDLSDFELTVHAHGCFVRKYRVGIGKDGSSPIGTFVVLNKVVNPQYTDPEGRVIAADDPSNPLGERWIDIGDGFGIHGTIEPDSIGHAVSRGCIRMLSDDVAEVFDLVVVGSEVVVRR
jgi:LysM repeat protein